MNRRTFTSLAALPLAGGAGAAVTPAAPLKMYVGTQNDTSDASLKVLAALGVQHVCSNLPSPKFDEHWSVEGLTKLRERVESFGIKLDMVPLPMSSNYITKAENPNIMMGKSPERDREIDNICQMVRNASKAGIPALKYNLTLLGVVRTGFTPGRGGAMLNTFVYEKAIQDPPFTEAGPANADQMWERTTYFLNRVIPVATENKVKMALHPNDPGMPPGKGFRGVDCVLGTVDGLKRFITINESPYHGLNFCQGTVSEMLKDPRREILDVIRYFGSRRKIFNVHFRNIKGGFLNFQETFPDDGDIDFVACIKVYKEVGFEGMLMPDHVPRIEGDAGGKQAFAFAYGYIKALLQAVA